MQCLEAQARAADLQLMRELEAFFGATDEITPTAGKEEEEVDAPSEGIDDSDDWDDQDNNDEEMEDDVDVVWGRNDREQEQQQASKEGDEDEAILSNIQCRTPSGDTAHRKDASTILDDWEEGDDDINVMWLNHRE